MDLVNCFFCLETVGNEYMNLHPDSKFGHFCHSTCLYDYRVHTSNSLSSCPVCRKPVTSIDHRAMESVSPANYQEWEELIAYFSSMNLSGEEVLIRLYGDYSIYELPAKGSNEDKLIKKFLQQSMNNFESMHLTISGWNAISRFACRYDNLDLAKKAMDIGGSRDVTVSYSLSSPKVFDHCKNLLHKTSGSNMIFYSKDLSPCPQSIKTLYEKRGDLRSCRWQLNLLEESLENGLVQDWCQWVDIIDAKKIPMASFRNCFIMACVFDYADVVKWVLRSFSLTKETVVKYLVLSKIFDSKKSEIFLQEEIIKQEGKIKGNINVDKDLFIKILDSFSLPLSKIKEDYIGNKNKFLISLNLDIIAGIKFLTPTETLWSLFHNQVFNTPCACFKGKNHDSKNALRIHLLIFIMAFGTAFVLPTALILSSSGYIDEDKWLPFFKWLPFIQAIVTLLIVCVNVYYKSYTDY